MSISVQSLLKIYGEQKAVDQISFEVGKGEIVGFLGPNGAGKSTTMKILTGYLHPDGGKALVCGIDVQQDPLNTKRKIGYLPESNPLYYDMYVREYLHFMADIHKVPDPTNRVIDVIDRVGLGQESDKRISQLSKGYKQRVGLAAALIHDPEVLILDEPTTGLDPNQIIEIRAVIRALGREKTVLFSSHILQEVEAICDRIIIINKGKIIADSTVSALQSANSRPVIRIQFQETLEAKLIEKAVKNLSSLEQINPREWEIIAPDLSEAKKQLLELAVSQNLNIISLQSENQSLEDVFRTLTGKVS
ncbi:gliding motility-associated ABC transporter ATP-binding subunit GldA [Flavihumibacter profundi]|jgi:ABC-2 type transport system ATP-binding protein|uniref:gliding motility-associated ABC transporter ATP-binding subunit GldA n=1 Tax=Flavihumibacter profundi TaxID=2716883 RepID=UPI001CC72F52|nr:gliding motility-associated ABC transporter ATP-binding subunit GldA [Flavihumibacter profundi]MBZ5857917.1 gliding motility-associated ABC transporter ATP-binding subunit GldA [Flavihumibacter profundi]